MSSISKINIFPALPQFDNNCIEQPAKTPIDKVDPTLPQNRPTTPELTVKPAAPERAPSFSPAPPLKRASFDSASETASMGTQTPEVQAEETLPQAEQTSSTVKSGFAAKVSAFFTNIAQKAEAIVTTAVHAATNIVAEGKELIIAGCKNVINFFENIVSKVSGKGHQNDATLPTDTKANETL